MTVPSELTRRWPRTDFVTAVSLLERLTAGRPRIGEDGPFDEEALAFRHDPSFAFRPNEVSEIRHVAAQRAPEERLRGDHTYYELTTCILGLTGADSPLPLYHAEDLLGDGDDTLLQRGFLDLFHNRLTALLYRAIAKHHLAREFQTGGRDRWSARVLAMVGVDTYGGPDTPVSRPELLQISALLALGGSTGRSVENSLREILTAALGNAPLSFEQYTGGWVTFDPEQRIRLGKANSALSESFVLGTRAHHPAHKARVVIGPMSPEQARQFSPGGPHYGTIARVLPALVGAPMGFEVELLVDEAAFPRFVIGAHAPAGLGQGVMLSARKPQKRVARHRFDLDKHGA